MASEQSALILPHKERNALIFTTSSVYCDEKSKNHFVKMRTMT